MYNAEAGIVIGSCAATIVVWLVMAALVQVVINWFFPGNGLEYWQVCVILIVFGFVGRTIFGSRS